MRWNFSRLVLLFSFGIMVGLVGRAHAVIGSVDTPGYARWVMVSGSYAYVADDYKGLQVIDVGNPRNPAIAGSVDTPGNAKKVFVSGSFAYVADYWDGFHIVNISNPATPALLGSLYLPDAAEGVYVSGSYAYVADGSSGLKIINVGNSSAPAVVGGVNTPGYSLDVKVSGSYAYVADGSGGLQVIDVTNPAAPKIAGGVATPGTAKGVGVSWPYAYIAADSMGIQVIDVSDPKKPKIVGSLTPSGTCQSIYVAYPLLFVAADVNGLRVVDVSNPAAPSLRGTEVTSSFALGVFIADGYAFMADYDYGLEVIDVRKYFSRIVGTIDTPGNAQDVKVSGSYAYVADDFGGFQVIDITTPAAPVIVGALSTPGSAKGVFVSGSYAYVADDFGGFQVIDIDNPLNPVLVGSVQTPGSARAVFVSGPCAFVADGSGSGLQVIDINDPEDPVIVGAVITPGSAENVQVVGSYALVADGSAGLQVIDVSLPQSPAIIGSVYTAGVAYKVDVSGSLAYLADGGNGLAVIDLTNPDSPIQLGGSETDSSAKGVRVQGSYAFVAANTDGLNIFDVSDSVEPFLVVAVDTPGIANKVELSGPYAYVADGPNGLQIISIANFPCGGAVPAAPPSITYPLTDTDGNFPVNWGLSSYARSYALERADNPSFQGSISVYDGPSPPFEQTGLFAGTFYYRVRAANDCGASPWTIGPGIAVSSFPLRPGSINYAAGSCGSNLAISWAPSEGATEYRLERAANLAFTGASVAYTGPLTSYNEASLAYGTYYYRVRASNSKGVSAWRTGGPTAVVSPPPAPASITYPQGSCTGSLIITWPAVSGAVSYTLQRATNIAFNGATQVYQGTTPTFTDSGIPGGLYYYRVQANNQCGGGAWKAGPGANVSSIPAAPGTPSYPSGNCGSAFAITWSSVAGASEYTLQRATNVGFSGATTVYSGALTSFEQPALSSGTYYYRVRSGNACGSSNWADGAAVTVTLLPSTPDTITYPPNLCGSTVTVSWAAATGAATYTLERAANGSFSGAVEVYSGPATSFADTGLLSGSYYYRVKAVNGCGSGNWRSGSAVGLSNLPVAPQTINYPATNCSGAFTVTWTAAAGATGYTLQIATGASFAGATTVYTGSATSMNQTGLADGTYYFRVRAGNGCGDTAWTSGAAVIVGSLPAVPAPLTYPSSNCGTSFTVSWTAVSGATSYILQRATTINFTDAAEVFTGSSTSFSQPVLPAATYYYRVRSSNGCGLSSWQPGAAIVVTSLPSSPGTISYPAANCSGAFTVSWTTAAGATGYTLQRATSASFAGATTVYTGSASSFDQTGLADGTYYFRVRAGNGCGDTAWTSGAAVTVGSLPAVPAPLTYPSSNCGTSFTVSWTAASGATSYILQRATTANFTDAAEVFTGSSTSFSQPVLPAATYYYRVRSSNGCGFSSWQTGAAIVVTSLPSSPGSINYPPTNCSGAFTVSWTAVSGASTYTLQRAKDPAFSDAVTVSSNSGTSFAETGLAEGSYYYRVRANNDCGSSSWQAGSTVTVTGTLAPPAGIRYPAGNCSGSFKVEWDAVDKATAYTLQRATTVSFTDARDVYSGAVTSFDQTGLGVGTYYYRVLATSACGNGTWRTGSAVAVTATPGSPATIAYPSSNCGGNFTVTWAPVNGATGYLLQRASNAAFSDAQQVYGGAGTSYGEINLTVGTYYYRVLAKNDCGSSGWAVGAAVVITAAPPAPAGISYDPTTCNGTVGVSWSAVGGASSYTLQRAGSANFADAVTVYTGSEISFVQTDLAAGTYYFQVRAVNGCGTSGWKTGPAVTLTAVPPQPGSLSYPTGICGVSFVVSWTQAQAATSYTLQRAANPSFTNAVTVYNGASSFYNETLPGSGTYYYRVRAANSCGTGEWKTGPAVAATPASATPVSIAYPSVSCSGKFTVTWDAVEGLSNYALQRSMDPSFGDYTGVYSGPATSYTEPGVGFGTFYYRVRATNGCGTGDWKTGGAVAIGASPPPSPPATITYPSSSVGGSFTVNWVPVSGAADYTLQRATSAGFTGAVEVYKGTVTSFTQTGLANGTYYYRVRANSDCGNSGWQAGNAIVLGGNQPPLVSGPPQGPAIGAITVSYKFTGQATDPDADPVQYRFSWGDGKQSSWSTNPSRSHAWPLPNTYCVKVQARDSKGALSGWSQCATVVVSHPPVLTGPPVGPSTGKALASVKFTGQATDLDGDSIQYRFSWGDGKTSTWSAKTSAYHKWTVPAAYCVKVQAMDGKGLKSSWSGCATIQIAE